MTNPDPAIVARSLTEAQREMLDVGPFWGVRPGDNAHPLLAMENARKPGHVLFGGEDVEVGFRLGLLSAEHRPEQGCVLNHSEYGELICDWRIGLTPLGLAVKAHIQQGEEG